MHVTAFESYKRAQSTRGKDGRTLSVALGLKGCTSGEIVRAPHTGAAPNRNYAIVTHLAAMVLLIISKRVCVASLAKQLVVV